MRLGSSFGREDVLVDGDVIEVRRKLEDAGLGPIESRSSKSYLVVGDAPIEFLETALRICEGLSKDFMTHFLERKFEVRLPAERLTVVALSGPSAFAAYLDTTEDEAVGGQYDISTNRLVMFDNRRPVNAGPLVQRANTVSLMHEAMHQLTYNTGLLERNAIIPLAINEGLGTYAETRRPDGRVPIGRPNTFRLLVLAQGLRERIPLIPANDLFAARGLPGNPDAAQQFYAQCWLLVYTLMGNPRRVPQFRKYLEGLKGPKHDPVADPVRQAEAEFGDLAKLERDMLSRAKALRAGLSQRPAMRFVAVGTPRSDAHTAMTRFGPPNVGAGLSRGRGSAPCSYASRRAASHSS